jgi:hypothetical protein
MSSFLPDASRSPSILTPTLSLADLAGSVAPTTWLWHGYLAHGNVTLLTSQWKTGKTTLLSVLMARLKTGGPLAGRTVAPGRALVVSEEAPNLWAERGRNLDFGNHIWLCRPFRECPDLAAWRALIQHLAEVSARERLDLAVIDPLAMILPAQCENLADQLTEALISLRQLTQLGLAVLLLHHPRKGIVRPGQAARGNGVLTGFADIVIEMFTYSRANNADRRRRLFGYSRHEATPRQWVIELNADGKDYQGQPPAAGAEQRPEWLIIEDLLVKADSPLTQKDLHNQWPTDLPLPTPNQLWRYLDRASRDGLLSKRGAGTKRDPFQYALAELET